jgi:hypothetical protein
MTRKLGQHLAVQEAARRDSVEEQYRLPFSLLANEDMKTVDDDALSRRFVLFNQPRFPHMANPERSGRD